MLSDEDIRQALGKDIVIEPFSDRSLSPVGYDLRVGDFVYVLDGGPLSSPQLFRDDPLLQPRREVYSIPARATVQILSKEIVWVSRRIAGTLHSKVSLVTKGLSPISTTLDPGWFGPFLITFTNQSDRPIELRTTDTFATIVFHRLATPTRRASVRQDLQVIDQLQDQSQEYVAKMGALMKDDLFTVFKARVDSANRPVAEKIVAGIRSAAWRDRVVRIALETPLLLAILAIIVPAFLWNDVKGLFNNISYDGSVMVSQFTAVGVLISLRLAMRRRS